MSNIKNIQKKYLLQWFVVILSLLLIPKSAIIIIVLFSILFLFDKIDNLDVAVTFFLIYFIQNGLNSLDSLVMLRYILIPILIAKTFLNVRTKKIKLKPKKIYLVVLLLTYLLFNVIFVSVNSSFSFIEYLLFILLLIFSYKAGEINSIDNYFVKIVNIQSLYYVIIVMSIAVIPITNIAYARNGVGLQGITVHPNAFGVFLAPFCGYMLVKFLHDKRKIYVIFFFLSLILLFLSLSRTSFFSFVLGTVIYFFINSSFRSKFSKIFLWSAIPLIIITIFNFNSISNSLSGFLIKSEGSGSFVESVEQSRGLLIKKQLANIEENMLFGIGFKIPSNKIAITKTSSTDEVYYEKGNMLMASLEELGIVGTIIFVFVLIRLLRTSKKSNSEFQILAIIAIISAMGEATLFSIGGLGVFIWILVFLNRFQIINKVTIKN